VHCSRKIVATSAKQFIVLVDHTKRVPAIIHFPDRGGSLRLGDSTRNRSLTKSKVTLRQRNSLRSRRKPAISLWMYISRESAIRASSRFIESDSRVVETGLFVSRTDVLIVGTPQEIGCTVGTW
jgi:ribose 5-phosphate isomerase A